MCLMVGKTSGVSILGNFQQQNMHVLYNLRRGKITFAKASCESMPLDLVLRAENFSQKLQIGRDTDDGLY